MKLEVWAKELRIPFLSLPIIFVPLGITVALLDGYFNLVYGILTLIGIVCIHASVNVLNDYFDFKSGIDTATTPTPFSGGSRVLPENLLTPRSVLIGGIILLAIGSLIGLYFLYIFNFPPLLIALISIAIITSVAYSPVLSKIGVGEVFVFLNFGPLLFTGVYYIQSGGLISTEAMVVGSIVGLMTTGILYINQFPDTDADKSKGRFHLVARLGKKRAAGIYKYIVNASYVIIILGIVTFTIPPTTIIALITIPKFRVANAILQKEYEKIMELIPAMGNTVMGTIQSGILLLVGYLIWYFLSIYFPGVTTILPENIS
ncbi:MAG: prenyltransferase [Nitrososphaerales archaeon]|nr:prenyltransferase [Nitrososphaerales archaeon]